MVNFVKGICEQPFLWRGGGGGGGGVGRPPKKRGPGGEVTNKHTDFRLVFRDTEKYRRRLHELSM